MSDAAERLRQKYDLTPAEVDDIRDALAAEFQRGWDTAWDAAVTETKPAERRATVERIRAEVKALDYRMIEWYHPLPRGGYSLHQVVTWSDVFAILDAEAK